MKTHQALLVSVFLILTASVASAKDKDNNPPGPAGGKGTNWENPAGPKGGPGASPDRWKVAQQEWKDKHDRDNNPPGPKGGAGTNWEKSDIKNAADLNHDGVVDEKEKELWRAKWKKKHEDWKDKKEDWKEKKEEWKENREEWQESHPKVNPPGPKGGPGHGPGFDKDNNPPGPAGGKGTNWENPAGPKGGPGASPNRKKNY